MSAGASPLRILVFALGALLLAPPLSAATLVRNIQLQSTSSEGARLVLDFSGSPGAPKVFRLSNPERVVIDLPSTRLAQQTRLPAAAGPVSRVRDGAQPQGTLRLVLDMTHGLAVRQKLEGQTLVVDIGRAPSVAPGDRAAPPVQRASTAAEAQAPAAPVIASKPVTVKHAPADAGRDIIVAIDPGHGGKDPGAIGRLGTREKDVVLAIARALAKRIDAEPGMRAFLTRNDDRFILLEDRATQARRAGADIFISVHADAIHKRDVAGSSVYVLSAKGASSEAAKWLADQENSADLRGGVPLADKDRALASVLVDLSQTASIGESAVAARSVLQQLDRVGTIRKTQVQNAAFVVLKSRGIPAMLIETAFISNPGEEQKLRTPSHQQAVADAIFSGVREYFRQSPPDGTLFARQREQQRLVASSTAP